jgi:hypothetical protein
MTQGLAAVPRHTRIFGFRRHGYMVPLELLAEHYPLKQTQALVLAIEETDHWIALGQQMLGDPAPPCLQNYSEWLVRAADFLDELLGAINQETGDEDPENKSLVTCGQTAGNLWYDELDEVIAAFPKDGIELKAAEGEDNEDLRDAVERMATFWIENVHRRLVEIKSVMSGSRDVLWMLREYQTVGMLIT